MIEHEESFEVRTADNQSLAYVYFCDDTVRQMSMKRLSKDVARRVAVNIAKLPRILREK